MTMTLLKTALLDLLFEIEQSDITLIVGGGYGLYLKANHIKLHQTRTILNELPEPRSTNDLDLFLRVELLTNSERLKPFAEALSRLGYEVVPGAEKYQFVRKSSSGAVKIDLLTAPKSQFPKERVKRIDDRRVQPKPPVGIHAHPVNEAPTLEQHLVRVRLIGQLSNKDKYESDVWIPNTFTYSMMKLFAFKDRLSDANKAFGRYHALDLYMIIATTSEEEWHQALELRKRFAQDSYVGHAAQIVQQYYSSRSDIGLLRLQESPYYRRELQIDEFVSALRELFAVQ